MATVRGKCITQLLLLGAIDSIQVCVVIILYFQFLNIMYVSS